MFKINNTNLNRHRDARRARKGVLIYDLQIEYRNYLERYRRVQNNANTLIRKADEIIKNKNDDDQKAS